MNAKPVQELVEQLISESEQRTNARLRGIEVTLERIAARMGVGPGASGRESPQPQERGPGRHAISLNLASALPIAGPMTPSRAGYPSLGTPKDLPPSAPRGGGGSSS